jgi:hypothetical protein
MKVNDDPKIFGKLKYQEQRIPSTALDQNMKVLIGQKRQAKTLSTFSFINPAKLQFFKSQY